VIEELSHEDVVSCIDRAVEELLAEAGITGPPVDALAVARHLGLSVEEGAAPRGRQRRAAATGPVVLRPEMSEEQRHAAVALVVGDQVRGALLGRLGLDAGQKRPPGRSLLGLFADRLLVPAAWFTGDAPSCGYDLAELKSRYRTAAAEVIAWRLLDLPAACIITVVDDDKVHRRRSNAWRVKKQLEPAEQECQQHVARHGGPHEVRSAGWTVRGWPVPHAGWKRVILRSVCPDALGTE
jgi:hypothetical protein